MSLDAKIKEMAQEKLKFVLEQGNAVLESLAKEYGLETKDVARLLSGHKTKTTEAKVVKDLSDIIATRMMNSLGGNDTGE